MDVNWFFGLIYHPDVFRVIPSVDVTLPNEESISYGIMIGWAVASIYFTIEFKGKDGNRD